MKIGGIDSDGMSQYIACGRISFARLTRKRIPVTNTNNPACLHVLGESGERHHGCDDGAVRHCLIRLVRILETIGFGDH